MMSPAVGIALGESRPRGPPRALHQSIQGAGQPIEPATPIRGAIRNGYAVLGEDCEGLNNEPGEVDFVQYAALLHDIGKIHIRDYILNNPETERDS